ncbi:MAG TPA: class I SAM-dependent methyltransferase [Hyphomicrobiaceae bacterium]|jgi:SAM-dependent methyltransferase|nr:class I SAM-dependent methyltransferase [Hyphomicrobiaceae bacterium]
MIGDGDAVTREEVRWAYRTFLEREPESDEAIAAHMTADDLGTLARRFIESAEFRQRQSLPVMRSRFVPLDAEANLVEVDIDGATLATLVAHVRRCWEFLGRDRPHYSVLTHAAFRPDALPENETAFWASGEHEAEMLIRILKRHGIGSTTPLACIDFGCGVGRVTAPLAERFATVHAYDISEPHIEIAKTRTDRAVFHVVRDLPVALAPADIFHSRIVFQHNPPPIIAMLIRSALGCLKPNGIAVFQVPTYEMGYRFKARGYIERMNREVLDMEMHCLPQEHIFRIAEDSGCRILEVREDGSAAGAGRTISNTFVVQCPLH